MLVHNPRSVNVRRKRKPKGARGAGLVNTRIDKLPFELHIPTYRFCGPGTHLSKRLARGDKGINLLDEACKEHDIAYSQFQDIGQRHEADKILAEKALRRLKSSDAKFGEKLAAAGVFGVMKAKTKLGMGLRKRRKGKGISLKAAVRRARKSLMGKDYGNLTKLAKLALASIKKGTAVIPPKQRIIPIPKTGGFLPFLIPLFAGLSALGTLGGGAAGIVNAVRNANAAKKQLEEQKRHNQTMEDLAVGKGLYLRPYKQGFGLYLKPQPKNFQ